MALLALSGTTSVFATSIPSTSPGPVAPTEAAVGDNDAVAQIDQYILQSYEYAVQNGLLIEEGDNYANDEEDLVYDDDDLENSFDSDSSIKFVDSDETDEHLDFAMNAASTTRKRGSGCSYSAPSRVADCPSGYTNMGATCYKSPDSYTQFSRVADCPKGWTNMGATCYQTPSWTYPFGRSKGMSSMRCKSGEFRTGARCYKNCKPGYQNTGEVCQRWADSKGMDSMTCKSGEFRTGARCYKNCAPNYTNGGEVCTNWKCVEHGIEAVGKGIAFGTVKTLCSAQRPLYQLFGNEDGVNRMDQCIEEMTDKCGGEMNSCNSVITCINAQLISDGQSVDPCINALAHSAYLMKPLLDIANPTSWLTMAQVTTCIAQEMQKCATKHN